MFHPKWSRYSDIGEVLELSATFDDALKKDHNFTRFAVNVANRILADWKIRATWGKWGARIEPDKNKPFSRVQLERAGSQVMNHPSWHGLRMATHVFTWGPDEE